MKEKTDISNRLDVKYLRIKPDFDPGEEFKMNKYIVQIEVSFPNFNLLLIFAIWTDLILFFTLQQRWDEGKKGGRSALKKDLMNERDKLQNEEKAKKEAGSTPPD